MVDPFQSDNRAKERIFILKVYFSTQPGDDKRYEIGKLLYRVSALILVATFARQNSEIFRRIRNRNLNLIPYLGLIYFRNRFPRSESILASQNTTLKKTVELSLYSMDYSTYSDTL